MEAKNLERVLKAVANKRRLAVITYLKNRKEASVSAIAKEIKLSFKSTSRHLAILRSADIIERDQRSTQMFYSLVPDLPPTVRHLLSLL